MKKKFVLTLALVLMVAASLMAATPVAVSGEFKAGYKFTFDNSGASVAVANDDGTNAAYASDFKVAGENWDVSYAVLSIDGDASQAATANIYLDKALAAQGMDMGDLTVKLSVGNYGTMSGPTVYSDPNGTVGDNSYKVRMKGTNSAAATVGYGALGSVYFAADPTDGTNKPIVIGATVTPVDGISAAVAYTNYAEDKFYKVAGANPIDADGAFGGSAKVDVAALAGLDFGLTASAQDIYFLGLKENYLLAAASASYQDIAAYAEYQLFDGTSNVVTKVTYSGIENVSAYAKLTLADLSNIATTVGAGASYMMGDIKWALDAGYATSSKAFTLTPSVKVTF